MSTWKNQYADISLDKSEIHIWLSYLNMHEARLKHLYPLLSAHEKQRSEQFKFYKHRKLFIASHGFLHSVLANYINTSAEEIEFSYGENGKPSIINEQNQQQIQFNMSHSGHLAILAVCKQQCVGIDIEHRERNTDWQGIARRFFTENEQQKFFKLSEEEQKDAFFKIWTRKEAHMKVTGQGLSLAPTQFEVSVPPQAADFIGNINSADSHFYKMQDIALPEMYKDYFACLSANFDFEKTTRFIYS